MRSNFQNYLNYSNSNENVNQDSQCIRSMYYNNHTLCRHAFMLNVCLWFPFDVASCHTQWLKRSNNEILLESLCNWKPHDIHWYLAL